jgi:hypothetical protein
MEYSLDQLQVLLLALVLLLKLILELLDLLLLGLVLGSQVHYDLAWHQGRLLRVHVVQDLLNSIKV